ncbi:FMN-linked oxidoreductase [Wallemia mellicola]|uniref:FMN-linked oxidoreductase n=2 Tax=Wallemia mellicola TaxID=1708541 RepID=I4Y6A1_WALMC|nr:FMN-linked oxidoreductase [Wallemia mellicola CBS 633.66]TIB80258.1 FMN-linked oxidoreductase [Wallemia mellicola]EIM19493.1 FMN-linked oxidoreductase [Wallemia mellicola CBS 633.66]TIB88517.1 FMN-linked oxidoreductase [Wallemia mellicola]TIB95770.1 FMN-linked oxidoreductase [Wallemia mellicola]TIB98071.1 FMN-linked oxidoreductase [Wallemia mellicola]|eukprot:XP_006960418.1 FMN-linked oxidoreductase [Wallemia mellicola CBS 633.66]
MSNRYSDEKVDVSKLAEKVTLPNGVVIPNRFLKSPMTERLSTYNDDPNPKLRGIPTQALIDLYKEWGQGQIGLIIAGNTPVAGDHLEAPANPVLGIGYEEPERLEQFRKLVSAAKAGGSVAICQITHSGRQCYKQVNPNPIAPSAVPVEGVQMPGVSFGMPKEATKEDIKNIVKQFAYSAKLCKEVGYDGVQAHSAHGYLISSFLGKHTNRRTDEYGGSLENRARILLEIIDAIRAEVNDPKFIVSVKLNSQDFREDSGLTSEESQQICQWLDERVDLIELSGGSYERSAFMNSAPNPREAYFIQYSENVRKVIKHAVIAVTGGFRSSKAMAEAVETGATQMVGLARPLCGEPRLCKDILEGKVSSARKSLVNPMFSLALAGSQLTAVGYHAEPWDDSNEEKAKKFEEIFTEYASYYGKSVDGKPVRPDKAGIAGFMKVVLDKHGQHYGISQNELIAQA